MKTYCCNNKNVLLDTNFILVAALGKQSTVLILTGLMAMAMVFSSCHTAGNARHVLYLPFVYVSLNIYSFQS
jgi:hypothetical protein